RGVRERERRPLTDPPDRSPAARVSAMDSRPHIAVLLENAFYSRVERLLRRRGWREELIAYTGYGNAETARVLARVLLTRDHADAGPDATVAVQASEPEREEAEDTQRGWRQFITAPAAGSPVRVRVGEAEATVHTNHGGYIDVDVRGHGLEPGWHEATLT